MSNDQHNIQGTPDGDIEADTASGGAPESPEAPDSPELPDTTDENDRPVDNPSGG